MELDRRISLHKLEVLNRVVELGGVGHTAEQLLVAQPVVTAHIRSLEQRIGARLFYRKGRQLHLTDAGEVVHAWAEEVLMRTRELERHLAGLSEGTEGTIALGASMTIGSYRLPHILTAFRAAHAHVALRLSVSNTEHMVEDARVGAFDFAVVVSDSDLVERGVSAELLGEDEIVLVTAPDRPPHSDAISLAELSKLSFIEAPKGIMRRRFVERELNDLGVEDRDVVLEVGHPEGMKRAAREGLGVSMLFRSAVADDLTQGSLREVRVTGARVTVPVYLVYRKGKSFSPLHRELIDSIRDDYAGEHAAAPAAV